MASEERNSHCVITTGCNALNEGLDLVVEGEAARVSDEARLQRVAELSPAPAILPALSCCSWGWPRPALGCALHEKRAGPKPIRGPERSLSR